MLILFRTKAAVATLRAPPYSVTEANIKRVVDLGGDEKARIEILPEAPEEAIAMMKICVNAISDNRAIPDPLLRFIGTAFKVIIESDGADKQLPARAFGLLHSRKGRPKRNEERDRIIAKEVADRMEEGATLLEASLALSEQYKIHESNIQKIYCANIGLLRASGPSESEYPY